MLILVLVSLIMLVKLLRQAVPGHYRVFTGAGRALWAGQNPYGSDFGTSVGYYFYSPTCALTVFGPLSALPEKLGIFVFMAGSWALFVWGARKFAAAYQLSSSRLQWFWGLIAAQMAGGILASKLEIAIAGILMALIAGLVERPRFDRRAVIAAIALAALLNWKFQPLPIAGLLLLSWIWLVRDWKLPLTLGVALAGWYALPYLFFSPEFMSSIHETWQATFGPFVAEAYLNFENVFAFLNHAFGISMSFQATQIISGIVGLGLAAILAVCLRRKVSFETAALLATTLGTLFMTAFSPLGQNNALILYAPLLLAGLINLDRSKSPRTLKLVIGIVCAVMILAYSDLVPHGLRELLRGLTVKPLACIALAIAITHSNFRTPTLSQ